MKKFNCLSAFIGLSYAPLALSGGLYISEFGQPNQGASGAGGGALVEDASTAWQNPAGIVFLDKPQSMVSFSVIDSSIEFSQSDSASSLPPSVARLDGTRPASDGGDAGGTAVGAGFFHAGKINDKWGWGLSMTSISAAIMEHDDQLDFAGRYWVQEVDLLTVSLAPALSYRVNERLSLGLSAVIMYGQLDLDVAIPGVAAGLPEGQVEVSDGDDLAATVSVSAYWQATDRLSLGMIYVSETEVEFDSDLDITLPVNIPLETISADVEFSFPQTLRLSQAYELNDQVTLLASIAWEDWSTFDRITIGTPSTDAELERNWDDTWRYSLGVRWARSPRWTFYTGIAYDTDPTRAADRTADMPIDEQWRYSGGATYERDNGHKASVVLTYADYGDGDIENGGSRPGGVPWTVTGDYSTNEIFFLGLSYGW